MAVRESTPESPPLAQPITFATPGPWLPLVFAGIGLTGGAIAMIACQIAPGWFPTLVATELTIGVALSLLANKWLGPRSDRA